MKAGFKFKNEFGVNMVLDESRPFKLLGSFVTRGDEATGSITDDNIVGKNIAILPSSIKMVSAGSNNVYMYPSSITVNDNKIEWEYTHIKPTPIHNFFHGIMDNVNGIDTVYAITWRYGYF